MPPVTQTSVNYWKRKPWLRGRRQTMIKCHSVGLSARRGIINPSSSLIYRLLCWGEGQKQPSKTKNALGSKVKASQTLAVLTIRSTIEEIIFFNHNKKKDLKRDVLYCMTAEAMATSTQPELSGRCSCNLFK